MSDDAFDATWITEFAARLGVDPPDEAQRDALLSLAGRGAHGSGDRRNAPLACYLLGLRLGTDGTSPTVAIIDGC